MSTMVLTKNFFNFIRTVLLSNSTDNGVMCADTSAALKGWWGVNSAGSSVVTSEKFTDTSNTQYSGGLCGATADSNGYYGQQASLNKFSPANNYEYYNEYKGMMFFKVGTGTTQPTANDYDIEDEISGDDVRITLSSVHFNENNHGVLRFHISLKNISQESVTVSELGMFKMISLNNYATSSRTDISVLFGRQVFSEEFSITPQEVKTLILDIRI